MKFAEKEQGRKNEESKKYSRIAIADHCRVLSPHYLRYVTRTQRKDVHPQSMTKDSTQPLLYPTCKVPRRTNAYCMNNFVHCSYKDVRKYNMLLGNITMIKDANMVLTFVSSGEETVCPIVRSWVKISKSFPGCDNIQYECNSFPDTSQTLTTTHLLQMSYPQRSGFHQNLPRVRN